MKNCAKQMASCILDPESLSAHRLPPTLPYMSTCSDAGAKTTVKKIGQSLEAPAELSHQPRAMPVSTHWSKSRET